MKYWIAFITTFIITGILSTILIGLIGLLDMIIFVVKFVIWPFVIIYMWAKSMIELWDHMRVETKRIWDAGLSK